MIPLRSSFSTQLAMVLALGATNAFATFPFFGSDDFSDGTLNIGAGQRWTYSSNIGDPFNFTPWTESGGTLNLSTDGGRIAWATPQTNANGFNGSYVYMNVDVTIAQTGPDIDNYAGIRVFTWSEAPSGDPDALPSMDPEAPPYQPFDQNALNARYELMIDSNGENPLVYANRSIWNGSDWNTTQIHYHTLPHTDNIRLSFLWNLDDGQLMAAWLDPDESYEVFNVVATMDPFGADAGLSSIYQNGYGLELFGFYERDGPISLFGSESVPASLATTFHSIEVGQFSAVPEPSSYAALTGLFMLGLTVLRRRPRESGAPANSD